MAGLPPAPARAGPRYARAVVNDGVTWWYLLVGIGIGIAAAWLLGGRLAHDDEVADRELRRDEAAWISGTIERRGGVAPPLLVEEVLELHQTWLTGETSEGGSGPAGARYAGPGAGLPVPGTGRPVTGTGTYAAGENGRPAGPGPGHARPGAGRVAPGAGGPSPWAPPPEGTARR